MAEMTDQQIEQKVLEILKNGKLKVRQVSRSIDADKKQVDKVIGDMAKQDKLEYLYLDTSYVQIKGK